jgi:hypothetical protein
MVSRYNSNLLNASKGNEKRIKKKSTAPDARVTVQINRFTRNKSEANTILLKKKSTLNNDDLNGVVTTKSNRRSRVPTI